MAATLTAQIDRFADGHKMPRTQFPPEGELPLRENHSKGRFWAFKKIPIRGYGWFSERKVGTFFISHYVNKRYDVLHERDTRLVHANWRRIEEQADEC